MVSLDQWIKADALNIYQIALLLERIDPSILLSSSYHALPGKIIDKTNVYFVMMENAILLNKMPVIRQVTDEFDGYNWNYTLVDLSELKFWLLSRDITGTLFDESAKPTHSYSTPQHRHYAPKLAAAVDAWTAVTSEPKRLRGKTPKQALEIWLTENASRYGLLNKDGTPNKTGIEEVAKVANWNRNGGAPSTPTLLPEPPPSFGEIGSKVIENPPRGFRKWEEDDEIPF